MVQAEAYAFWNAAMCFCALPLGGKMAGLPAPSMKPLLLAAGADGALSVLGAYGMKALSLLGLPVSILICFRAYGIPACMRCAVTTLLSSFLTGGAMTALMEAGCAPLSSGMLALGAGLTAWLMAHLIPNVLCNVRQVELRVEDRAVILPAMLDSGNLLRDPVTGLPVLVIPAKAARTLFPGLTDPAFLPGLPLGFRLLNVRTAAGSALLPMFRPDECRIYLNGSVCRANLQVAVAGRDYSGVQALVPMAALPSDALPV